MNLRPYQAELIRKIKTELCKGKHSVCAVLGCGGGKSIIQGCIAKSATDKGNKVLFLVHRKELCEQIEQTFRICGVDMRFCQIAMVQTVSRRLGKHSWTPALIITDECHHSLSASYHRHGKAFYKPYRNFFCTKEDDLMWNKLCSVGLAKCSEEHNGCVDFYLTRLGIEWLGRQLQITIKGTGLE